MHVDKKFLCFLFHLKTMSLNIHILGEVLKYTTQERRPKPTTLHAAILKLKYLFSTVAEKHVSCSNVSILRHSAKQRSLVRSASRSCYKVTCRAMNIFFISLKCLCLRNGCVFMKSICIIY